MRLAACNEMFEGLAWPEVCRLIAEHGYEGVEIAPFTFASYVTEITPAQRREIKEGAAAHGLTIVGLHWLLAKTEGFHLTHPDRQIRRNTAEYLGELVRFCADIGGQVLVFGSPQQRNQLPGVSMAEAMSYAADTLQAPCRLAEELGVTIALEPLSPEFTNFLTTMADAAALLDQVNSKSLKLHLDAKAAATEQCSMPELVHRYAAQLAHVHVNDVNGLGPGMGDLDLAPLISALRQVGYDGFLSVEAFDFTPGPVEILRQSRAYLESL